MANFFFFFTESGKILLEQCLGTIFVKDLNGENYDTPKN